ncbi:MAG: peptidylprolyl isomerase [Muribaculaceae bacterium]|nr:peptidylprolyl isomerase [Muribaculaceae bacterium]
MKKLLISASILSMALAVVAAKNNDPILMTVNGLPVHKSEFQYLYNKNNSQQLKPQTLDEYVEMFVNYKLKVADALAAGLDTTTEFDNEYAKFKAELADPYLKETTTIDSLVNHVYNQQRTFRHVKHLMMPLGQNNAENKDIVNRLDSIRAEILASHISWDDAVAKYSIDRGTNRNGGDMYWMMPTRFPYQFVDMAYATPVGQISPIVNSGFGNHIIYVVEEIPNPGEVKVEHILKLTPRNADAKQIAEVKAKIDSIYNVLKAGADFADVAKRESDDPGSASQGGALDWFGKGMMVAPFDSAAFAMADGQLSEPVRTSYGFHILHKSEHRDMATLDKMRPQIEAIINNDERINIPFQAKVNRLKKQFKASLNQKGLDQVKQLIVKNGGYDSLAIQKIAKSDITVYNIGKSKCPIKDIAAKIPSTAVKDADNALLLISNAAENAMNSQLLDLEREQLINSNTEYRNLVNEYRDGILLFNIANTKVWERAATDTEGLENYFKQHKDKYTWDKPKFKGYVIFAENDSTLDLVKDFVKSYDNDQFDHNTFVNAVKEKFGRNAKVERVIAAKGDNPITDYLAFDAPKPQGTKNKWQTYFSFRGHIIDNPEEATDVRGQVITDYQNQLEAQWIEQLRKTYPVKINQKVLDTLK